MKKMPKFKKDEKEFELKINKSKENRYKINVPKVLMERFPNLEKGIFYLNKDKNELKLSIGLPVPYEEYSQMELYQEAIRILRDYLAHEISPDNAFLQLFKLLDRLQLKYNDKEIEEFEAVIYEINEPDEFKSKNNKDIQKFLAYLKYKVMNLKSDDNIEAIQYP